MNRKELFKTLNNLCIKLNDDYLINCGGCCFVAAVIAEQLEIVNIPFKVACVEDPTHYAIKVSDRYINRDDFKFDKNFDLYEWGSEYLFNTYKENTWNDCYNKRNNLIVETKIKSILHQFYP